MLLVLGRGVFRAALSRVTAIVRERCSGGFPSTNEDARVLCRCATGGQQSWLMEPEAVWFDIALLQRICDALLGSGGG